MGLMLLALIVGITFVVFTQYLGYALFFVGGLGTLFIIYKEEKNGL